MTPRDRNELIEFIRQAGSIDTFLKMYGYHMLLRETGMSQSAVAHAAEEACNLSDRGYRKVMERLSRWGIGLSDDSGTDSSTPPLS